MSTRVATRLHLAVAMVAPLAAAAALVPLRGRLDNANAALVLAAIVVAIAAGGRRASAVIAALSAATWFDFFHTQPYETLRVHSSDDIVTAVVLLTVGLVAGEIAVRARHYKADAARGRDELDRIHIVADLVSSGEAPQFVVMAVADELRSLLQVTDCRFELGSSWSDPKPLAQLQGSGQVTIGELLWPVDSLGFPTDDVELRVTGAGRVFGRYIIRRTIAAPVSFESRIVAAALATQVGAAFAAQSREGTRCG